MDADEEHDSKRIPRLKGSADYYTSQIYVKDLMNSLQTLFLLTEPRPEPAQARRRWDDANRKARSAIVQNLGTQPIVVFSELLERKHCSALEL